jgi:hypothetical protein
VIQEGTIGQPSRAQADGPLGRCRGVVDRQVEVKLLRMLLPRPLGRDVVGSELERDLLAVGLLQRDPVGDLADDLPTGELDVERGKSLDVRRVERNEFQASCHSHAAILPSPSDRSRPPGMRGRRAAMIGIPATVMAPALSP